MSIGANGGGERRQHGLGLMPMGMGNGNNTGRERRRWRRWRLLAWVGAVAACLGGYGWGV
ncbi:MAG: hypothetical protein K5867_01420 [Bacteroidales bacterium]|nr:hypothetical protein [Bacteroidales bacterium]